ncbi:MAG: glycosyltransferase family 4 protein [Candidatus Aminicenantes bacterium]|nr:glycosyltransferase family 4 protein [Candidatus Aminicenantes bacterium]
MTFPETARGLAKAVERTSRRDGIQAARNVLAKREVALGLRRPTMAVYDQAFQFIGGAQKYGLTMTAALLDTFDITLLANKDIRTEDFKEWYGLDLSACRVKAVKIPFYEARGGQHLDPAFVTRDMENPFHLVSRESGNYDVFVNNSMNEMVFPLAPVSVLICHFPERRPQSYFYADRYTRTVCNSRFTADWIEKKWGFSPHRLLYPPVDMEPGEDGGGPRNKIILSVARFEPEGFKRQREMIGAFLKLRKLRPDAAGDWRFVLAGGSQAKNAYLDRLRDMISDSGGAVELKVNIPASDLKALYREASIFWHMCGLHREDPGETEHFGMTAVEAMQNGLVPVVYDGGGLPEIVDHGVNGFRVESTAGLLARTLGLLADPDLIAGMGRAAREKAKMFSRTNFEKNARAIFDEALDLLKSPAGLDVE